VQALRKRRALAVPGRQQLTLVALAPGRVEDRRPHELGRALGVAHEYGVDEQREAVAVGADDVDGDLADRALQAQHRRVVRLVIRPPTLSRSWKRLTPTSSSRG
jgi:hypothetical protein